MRRIYLFLVIMLLQPVLLRATDSDSVIAKIVKQGQAAFREMLEVNRLNDLAGKSDQNSYVVNISTSGITGPTIPQVDSLDVSYIKQRRLIYDNSSAELSGSFYVYDKKKLNELNGKLVDYNKNATFKAYLVMIDFIPMIYHDTLVLGTSLDALLRSVNSNDAIADVAKAANNKADSIIAAIARPFMQAALDTSLIVIPKTPIVFTGYIKFKVFLDKYKLRTVNVFSMRNNLSVAQSDFFEPVMSSYLHGISSQKKGVELVEDYIAGVIGNGKDLDNYYDFESKILSAKTVTAMDTVLEKVSPNVYGLLPFKDRVHILKVLSGAGINDKHEVIIAQLLEKTPDDQIPDLFTAMQAVNDMAPAFTGTGETLRSNKKKGWALLKCIIEDTEDEHFGWGENNYSRLMQAFVQLSQHNPRYDDLKKEFFEDPDIDSRTIIWSKSHMFDLASLAPIGTNKYYVKVDDTDASISFSKEYVSSYYTSGKSPNMGAGMISSPTGGQTSEIWTDEGPYKLKPFDLVAFINKSNLPLIASTVANGETVNGLPIRLVPAILLEYAAHKKLNEDVSKGVEIGFDVMTVVIPFGEVAYLEKAFRYTYKTIDIIGKVAAAANIGVNTEMITDTTAVKVIKQFHAIAMDLQAANLVMGIKNGLVKKAVAEEYLTSVYAAGDGLEALRKYRPEYVRQVEILKEELEISAQAGGYGEAWLAGIKAAAASKVNSFIDRMKKLPFLTTQQDGKLFRFIDRSGEQVAHTVADGGLVIDRSAATIAENAEAVGSIERAAFRMSDNAADVLDDLIFVQLSDGTVQCIRNACFVAGTPVRTKDGMKPIEQIKESEIVLGYDIQTGDTLWQNVTNIFKKQASKLVRLVAGRDTIYSTPEHPYLTNEGWRSAIGLKVGQRLRLSTGSLAAVLSVATIDTSAVVYNFETAITHNYCIGQSEVVVHNDCHLMAALLPAVDKTLMVSFVKDFAGNTAILEKFVSDELSVGAWQLLHSCGEIRKDAAFLKSAGDMLKEFKAEESIFSQDVLTKLLKGEHDIPGFNEKDAASLKKLFGDIKTEAIGKGYQEAIVSADAVLKSLIEIEASGNLIAKELTEATRRHVIYGEVYVEFSSTQVNPVTGLKEKTIYFREWYRATEAYDKLMYEIQNNGLLEKIKGAGGAKYEFTGLHSYDEFLAAKNNLRQKEFVEIGHKKLAGFDIYEITPEVRLPNIDMMRKAGKWTPDEIWRGKKKTQRIDYSTCYPKGMAADEIEKIVNDSYKLRQAVPDSKEFKASVPHGGKIYETELYMKDGIISTVFIKDIK